MTEEVREKILQWIFDNHNHHDYEDIPRNDGSGISDEKFVDCPESDYPYVNSLDLEKFIKEL